MNSKPTDDQIRERAHQLWELAGRPEGREQEFGNERSASSSPVISGRAQAPSILTKSRIRFWNEGIPWLPGPLRCGKNRRSLEVQGVQT